MKPVIQRRRSTSAALSKALGKSKYRSREIILSSSHGDNGLPGGAFSNPNSIFILDERVQLSLGLQTQERHLFLFSNMLIVAKSKSSSSLKLKKKIHLSEVWTGSCLSEVSEKKMSPDTSFVIGWPTVNYVVTFSSSEVKERWLSILLWHIYEMKQTEYAKSLPMQILVMDREKRSSNTALSISNMETADDIIKKATEQLGVPGRPSDYHLWVISGRDNPAYPLIGHEHPFSIILGCLRGSVDQMRGPSNDLLLPVEYETSLLDQLPRDRRCQFILKPKPQVPVQLRRAPLQKHSKRKKSLIDWALRRSVSTPTGSPASQSPTNPRKLFGLSLTSVCPDGTLPKPIMDILYLLYHEGPSTRGIFRRSANAKNCKELKEKLNSGDDVQVDGESVFVAAAIITDFLRNIPDSVLSSDMHNLWMEAMDKECRAPKIEAIQSLVKQLPEANLVLLKHLFGVLHRIEQNAMENQMNAFNLALCIAPNMLWLPSPTGPEEESKSTKKVAMLVQFLIENSAEIFGGDISSLFQRPEKKKSRSVDDLLVQHNDSSDEMEYATSYQERGQQRYGLDGDDGLFSPSGGLILSEEQEDWDLFSEITACYQNKASKNASTDSYDLLEEESSFCSLSSISSLSPARNRCSSEPSVCLSSQFPAQDHEPVARQSSCDATIMHSHGDYIHRLKQLQLESQKLIDEGLSPGLSRARQSFWRSPLCSHAAKKVSSTQKTSLSNRSSFSSLSSTTTSPSASSLSSLDSAFSYCSESSAFSPMDVSNLPFMFGTSTRIHALSSKEPKKPTKGWHKPFTPPLPRGPGTVDFCHNSVRQIEDKQESDGRGEGQVFMPLGMTGNLGNEDNWDKNQQETTEMPSLVLGKHSSEDPERRHHIPGSSAPANLYVQREKSVKHLEVKCVAPALHNQGSLKRTKITVYMAPKERSPRDSPGVPEEAIVTVSNQGSSSDGKHSSSEGTSKSLPTLRVHIPQTVFYGQNAPLVLHSVSRRYHQGSVGRSSQENLPQRAALVEDPGQLLMPSEEKPGGGTFHFVLPASIRNTVREYFSQDNPKDFAPTGAEMVEKELIRGRVEWLRAQSCPSIQSEEHKSFMLAEETFV
ncbi:rho GTPase-activating protein 20-like isoform X2 [Thamnophis elegans]|uniref:rho GTPase-activating protein 20-like isoform X2 n=1 Tax=Thamnophis elegans TaxID=35005 RepID=UPI00137678B2|nr:rho GTPase-activating protein 20-like isoform X2 [Thamnophis elegans]